MSERTEFIEIMRAENPPMSIAAAKRIVAAANVIQRIATEDTSDEAAHDANERRRVHCPNCAKEYPTDRTYDLNPRRACPEHRAEKIIREECQRFNVIPSFDGDPRGACVKLKVPSGRNNSYGGGGWICVPARER